MSILTAKLTFCISTNKFTVVHSDFKEERLVDVMCLVVQSKIGVGKDSSKPNILDEYTISVFIDLSEDVITTSSDCGNKSLETRIIIEIVRQLMDPTVRSTP